MSTASISGVTFRLSEDHSRLATFAWECLFCRQRQRTCSKASREGSMRKHAAKADHRSAA